MGARDAKLVRALVDWFAQNRRDLPWRKVDRRGRRCGYAALVSELMLQQTQVSRVLEKFDGFLERFPDVAALARADEAEVLAAWSGLGYYRRARLLHGAAKAVAAEHGGVVPREVAALMELPGVGRYTAGAIASIAFGERAPIVDGNVARVLFRLRGVDAAADDKDDMKWAWERATELAAAAHDGGCVGAFNEGLMELGATVCTPMGPRCGECPLAALCVARRQGTQDRIPRAKVKGKKAGLWCASVVARDVRGRVLMERRGESGLWAGLWQAPTLESMAGEPSRAAVAKAMDVPLKSLREAARFAHGTTHRDVVFVVYAGEGMKAGKGRVWMTPVEIGGVGISNAQRRVLQMAKWSNCQIAK